MVHSQAPVPEGIKRSISCGRYSEAADALRNLVRREPSVATLVALADMNLQLGDLTEAKENALKAVDLDLGTKAAYALLQQRLVFHPIETGCRSTDDKEFAADLVLLMRLCASQE